MIQECIQVCMSYECLCNLELNVGMAISVLCFNIRKQGAWFPFLTPADELLFVFNL